MQPEGHRFCSSRGEGAKRSGMGSSVRIGDELQRTVPFHQFSEIKKGPLPNPARPPHPSSNYPLRPPAKRGISNVICRGDDGAGTRERGHNGREGRKPLLAGRPSFFRQAGFWALLLSGKRPRQRYVRYAGCVWMCSGGINYEECSR